MNHLKKVVTCIFLISYFFVSAQQFEKVYSLNGSSTMALSAIEVPTNEYLLAVYGGIIKTDANGNVLAEGTYTGFDFQQSFSFIEHSSIAMTTLSNGNYLLGGYGWLIVDPITLQPLANQRHDMVNPINGTHINSVAKKINGEIVMTGYSNFSLNYPFPTGSIPTPNLTVLNSNGSFNTHIEFDNPYYCYSPFPCATQWDDIFTTTIKATSDGGCILIGSTNLYDSNFFGQQNDVLVIKFDVNNNIDWQLLYGNTTTGFNDEATDIIELSTGGYIISGEFGDSNIGTNLSGGLMKIDASGNVIWTKYYSKVGPTQNGLIANSVVEKNATELLLVGKSIEDVNGSFLEQPVLLTINKNTGDIIPSKSYTYPNWYKPNTIIKTSGTGFIIAAGQALNPPPEGATFIKTDNDGKTGCEVLIDFTATSVIMTPHLAEFTPMIVAPEILIPTVKSGTTTMNNLCCQTTVSILGSPTLCKGTSQILDAGAGFSSYFWTDTQGNPIPGGTSQTLTITIGGTYNVQVTDAVGCFGTATFSVTVVPNPLVPVISGDEAACVNGTYTIANAQAGVTYNWVVAGGTALPTTGTTSTVTWGSTIIGGTITVIATNTDGCTSQADLIVYECCEPTVGNYIFNTTSSTLIPSPPFITNTSINTNYTSNSFNEVAINGTFTIDNNFLITDAHIVLGPNAKIIVKNGYTLTIDGNSYLHACSDKLWTSIFIEPTATLKISNSRIEDAYHAVESNGGGLFNIANTVFNNNYTGIFVDTYAGAHSGTVVSSTFKSTANLLFPFTNIRSQFGIDIQQVGNAAGAGIQIGDATSLSNLNLFRNLRVGIHAFVSNVVIYNNDFRFILPITLTKPLTTAAIWLEGANKTAPFNPKGVVGGTALWQTNKMVNNYNGILAEDNMNLEVIKNDIQFTTFNAIGVADFFRTIPTNVNILKNKIILAAIGVSVYNSVLPTTVIQENTITAMNTGTKTAIQCYNVFNSPYAATNTLIANNTITAVGTGIGLLHYTNALVRDNTIKNLYTTGTPTYGINIQACQKINVRSNTVNQLLSNTNTFGISIQLSEAILTTCNTLNKTAVGIQVAGPSVGTTILQNTFKNNTTGFLLSNNGFIDDQFRGTIGNELPSDNKWIGSFMFHTDAGPLGSNQNSATFYVRTAALYYPTSNTGFNPFTFTSTTGPLAFCTSIVPGPPGPKSKLIIQGQVGITADEKAIAKESLFSLLREDTTLLADLDFNTFHANYTNFGIGMLMFANKQLACPDTTGFTTILSDCENIITLITPEKNLKQVALIGLINRINETELTTQQISDLQVIAAKCPFTDGVAVYQARALLAPIDSTVYLNACENNTFEGNLRLAHYHNNIIELSNDKVMMYPNPTKNIINFSYTDDINATIIFYNLLGEKVIKSKLEKSMKVNQLKSGIYFVKIIANDVVMLSEKLIIE